MHRAHRQRLLSEAELRSSPLLYILCYFADANAVPFVDEKAEPKLTLTLHHVGRTHVGYECWASMFVYLRAHPLLQQLGKTNKFYLVSSRADEIICRQGMTRLTAQ